MHTDLLMRNIYKNNSTNFFLFNILVNKKTKQKKTNKNGEKKQEKSLNWEKIFQ